MKSTKCQISTHFSKGNGLKAKLKQLSMTLVFLVIGQFAVAQDDQLTPDALEAEALPQISVEQESTSDDVSEAETVEQAPVAVVEEELDAPLSQSVEDLKRSATELNRDLLILEEELLFPANTQIVVFVSMDVGEYFKLDSIKVSIDDKVVATHLYTSRQNYALTKGGIQRLYTGNVKNGEHEVTAIFTGLGPDNREYKRGATTVISKDDDAKLLEVMIRDSTKKSQPEFEFKEWEL